MMNNVSCVFIGNRDMLVSVCGVADHQKNLSWCWGGEGQGMMCMEVDFVGNSTVLELHQ